MTSMCWEATHPTVVTKFMATGETNDPLEDFMDVFFPRAVRVLDFYHAAEHLGDLAKAYRGGDAAAAEVLTAEWSHQMETSR